MPSYFFSILFPSVHIENIAKVHSETIEYNRSQLKERSAKLQTICLLSATVQRCTVESAIVMLNCARLRTDIAPEIIHLLRSTVPRRYELFDLSIGDLRLNTDTSVNVVVT